MPLQKAGFIELPAHAKSGGFDHAAVHESTGRIYVAHTANDAIDVIDIEGQKYVDSIPGLPAVAGALVAEASDLVFTSNRGAPTAWRTIRSAADCSWPTSAIPTFRARAPCPSSMCEGGGESRTCRSPDAPGGPSMIRSATPFTSTSPILRRSS